MLVARDYQEACGDSFFEYWESKFGDPCAGLPTGTGKSLVIAYFIRKALTLYPDTRILVLTHVKELIANNFKTLIDYWPTAPAGIFSAGLKRKDIGKQICFAGIQSVHNYPEYFCPDIILIDEAHTVNPNEETTYRKFIAALRIKNPFLKVGGLTATAYRLGQGEITEPGGLFTDLCFDLTTLENFNWFIDEGYLVPLTPRPMRTEFDISEVPIAPNGDFNLTQLQAAVDKKELTRSAVIEMIESGADRKHWLVFGAGIQHVRHIAEMLTEYGIPTAYVHSNTKEFPFTDAERDEAVRAFKAGEVRALVNNGIFTTGFDAPFVDLLAILRHTTSPGLWVQILGRGVRPDWSFNFINCAPGRWDLSTRDGRLACIAAGKQNTLVLDFARNATRLGTINDPVKPVAKKKRTEPGDCPIKVCEHCLTYNFSSARVCCECGREFALKIKLTAKAGTTELISKNPDPPEEPLQEWFDVETVTYSKHTPWNSRQRGSHGGVPSTLRVTYACGLRSFSEHICLEHSGHANTVARQWWAESSQGLTVPGSVDAAMLDIDTLRKPVRLRVWVNRKDPRIMYRELP